MVKNLPVNAGDTGLVAGWEDPTCWGTLKPGATATEPEGPRARAPKQDQLLQWEAHTWKQERPGWPQVERTQVQQWRPSAAINK